MTQIPSLGTFGPQCLGILAQLPLFVALVVVVLRYGAAPVWRRRPIWLRRFAAEEVLAPEGHEEAQALRPSSRRVFRGLTPSTMTVLWLSVITAVVGVVGVCFRSKSTQQFWMPVIPSVSRILPVIVYAR